MQYDERGENGQLDVAAAFPAPLSSPAANYVAGMVRRLRVKSSHTSSIVGNVELITGYEHSGACTEPS
jgi:hypothetical protein